MCADPLRVFILTAGLLGLGLPSPLWSTEMPERKPPESTQAQRFDVDPASTRVAFDITALWILRRRGEFKDIQGSLSVAPGRANAVIDVRIRVASASMPNPDHTELLLSSGFFDAMRHPWIEFRSDPFVPGMSTWMDLPGTLTLRGISRRVQFTAETSRCTLEPSTPCEVEVNGTLQRSQFGMTEYRRSLSDQVHLRIFARMVAVEAQTPVEPPAPPEKARKS